MFENLRSELVKFGVNVKDFKVDETGKVIFVIDFSEHNKKVAEEKDKKIDSLQEELWKLKEHLMKNSAEQCQKINNAEEEAQKLRDELKEQINENIKLINEIEEIKKDWCFARMSELEDRHQSDCIEINRLNVALEVMTEKYMKLREVHGL